MPESTERTGLTIGDGFRFGCGWLLFKVAVAFMILFVFAGIAVFATIESNVRDGTRSNPRGAERPPSSTTPDLAIFTKRGQFLIPGDAILDGRDGDIVVDPIRIWATANRSSGRAPFALRHGTPVRLIGARAVDDLTMFEIEVDAGRGWVSELFIAAP